MDNEEIVSRFQFHPANEVTGAMHDRVRALCSALALQLNASLPESREKSLAITKLEETLMWSNAAIARNL